MNNATNFNQLDAFIKRVNEDGKSGDIHEMFWVPADVIDDTTLTSHLFDYNSSTYEVFTAPNTNLPFYKNESFTKPQSFNDYTPKNNKLLCYPFNYLYVTNNNGDTNILKMEDFTGTDIQLRLMYSLSVGGSGKIIPLNYKGFGVNVDESINLGKFPTCQWSSDSYTNWLTQNAVNEKNSEVRTTIGAVKSALDLDFGSAVTGVAENVLNDMSNDYQASLLPDKISGTNTGDISFSAQFTNIEIHHMRATTEYLRIADDYLSRFGYKVNRVFTPNISGRRNWNYVEIGSGEKCAFSNINATFGVPQNDLNIINEQLQTGLTIWSDIDNIGDYSLTNDIV